MVDDLKIIKKYYGEAMMHFARDNFSTILEQNGSLSDILLSHFVPTKFLYANLVEQNCIEQFRGYIYQLFDSAIKEVVDVSKTPEELLAEAGYTLYECRTEEEIQRFKKYYAEGEELCTFENNRLNDCYVFFAVRNDALELRREDFPNPERQDSYGTSVISIQFTRDAIHLLSIKNRYNHKVAHPDATFSNDLDNIIEGLTDSFATHYGMRQAYVNSIDIAGYVLAIDGKYYKYNYEINNVYYCPNNVIIDNGCPIVYDKEKYLVMDYFVLDLEQKKVGTYNNGNLVDWFPNTIPDIKKITILNEGKNKKIILTLFRGEDIIIMLDDKNRITQYINSNITHIGDRFLAFAKCINKLVLPNVEQIGAYFCQDAHTLEEIELPMVQYISDAFLIRNVSLKRLYAPKLKGVGTYFCFDNEEMIVIDLPALERCGNNFFYTNHVLRVLRIPRLQVMGRNFCNNCTSFDEIDISQASLDVRIRIEQNYIVPTDGGRVIKM